MIDLRRRNGRPLRIGHRGAALLAPENTLEAFRAAVEAGVDLIEFDVLDLPRGPIIVAHSDHLDEVSHGAAHGHVRKLSLEQLRAVAPELPTLDDALDFFVHEAPDVGLHVDLKLRVRVDEVAGAIERHGLAPRTVVSSFHSAPLHAVARSSKRIRIGFTYPEDRFSVSRKPRLWPLIRLGLSTLRATTPPRLPYLLRRAGATALMLQHALVTPDTVRRAHRLGVPVLAWTVDEPEELERVVAAGVEGVITNDPTIFHATLP